jgi:hypothetical protein
MNLVLKTVGQRNMSQQLSDGARVGSCPETVLLFWDILGDSNRILANGAKTFR